MTEPNEGATSHNKADLKNALITGLALAAIGIHLVLRFARPTEAAPGPVRLRDVPLLFCLVVGGGFLLWDLLGKLFHGQFGSDLLAGVSIVTSVLLGEYLAGSLVVLMLSGGSALETYAVRSASSVLEALARRVPSQAHRMLDGDVTPVSLASVAIGDVLVVLPHEICPVDGTVVAGSGVMDESYLTGEPYMMSKTPGSTVLSGAKNGDSALTIRTDRLAEDSRYAMIMRVMRTSAQKRPRLRRLGDELGALYTPFGIGLAVIAWIYSGESIRFLAVLVVATPCPLLIGIPVAIIGSISLSARRGIIVKDPAVLETLTTCRTAIFDKTGTLTYGRPRLTEVITAPGIDEPEVLLLVASVERFSKHPLANAICERFLERGGAFKEASAISERAGAGLWGTVDGRTVQVTGRDGLLARHPELGSFLPVAGPGLECIAIIDDRYAATMQFRDEPRAEGPSFIDHLKPKHHFDRVMLVSGDRESEVRYLAERTGIEAVFAGQTPEQKMELVRREAGRANTVFVGDGINDAPALAAATVGIAFGQNSDITALAAGAVIMDTSLEKVDEFLHISRRMRTIALESAIGGMALSALGMAVAAAGYLPPVAGAVVQEVIDILAVANALRVALPPRLLSDCLLDGEPRAHAGSMELGNTDKTGFS
ncbi:MAG: heavy metal translocating P-type ATPase [Isosphaeraceae bacterium]